MLGKPHKEHIEQCNIKGAVGEGKKYITICKNKHSGTLITIINSWLCHNCPAVITNNQ
jgi:hypothetical protein